MLITPAQAGPFPAAAGSASGPGWARARSLWLLCWHPRGDRLPGSLPRPLRCHACPWGPFPAARGGEGPGSSVPCGCRGACRAWASQKNGK